MIGYSEKVLFYAPPFNINIKVLFHFQYNRITIKYKGKGLHNLNNFTETNILVLFKSQPIYHKVIERLKGNTAE